MNSSKTRTRSLLQGWQNFRQGWVAAKPRSAHWNFDFIFRFNCIEIVQRSEILAQDIADVWVYKSLWIADANLEIVWRGIRWAIWKRFHWRDQQIKRKCELRFTRLCNDWRAYWITRYVALSLTSSNFHATRPLIIHIVEDLTSPRCYRRHKIWTQFHCLVSQMSSLAVWWNWNKFYHISASSGRQFPDNLTITKAELFNLKREWIELE